MAAEGRHREPAAHRARLPPHRDPRGGRMSSPRTQPAPPSPTALPVASPQTVRREAKALLGQHRRSLGGVLALHAAAALAGLVGPALVGRLVDEPARRRRARPGRRAGAGAGDRRRGADPADVGRPAAVVRARRAWCSPACATRSCTA
nr:hypothetical protein [Angustibacter aerolatus]